MPAVHVSEGSPDTPPGTLTGRHMPPGATSAATPSLRYWRMRRALLQRELAEDAGIHITSVQRAESGQALRLNVIRRLAEALGVTPGDLMGQPPE